MVVLVGMWKEKQTKMGNCEVLDQEAYLKVDAGYGCGELFQGKGNILVCNFSPVDGWENTALCREQVGIVTQKSKGGAFCVDCLDDEDRSLESLSKFSKITRFMLYQTNVLSKSAYAVQEGERKAARKAQNAKSK